MLDEARVWAGEEKHNLPSPQHCVFATFQPVNNFLSKDRSIEGWIDRTFQPKYLWIEIIDHPHQIPPSPVTVTVNK